MTNGISTKHKVLNILLSVIFLLFAYVQLNDPDPMVWFSIYFLVAIGLLVSTFRGLPLILLYVAFAALILFAGYHLPYFVQWLSSEDHSSLFGEMSNDRYYIEGTREFFGLLIALAALVHLIFQNRNRQ